MAVEIITPASSQQIVNGTVSDSTSSHENPAFDAASEQEQFTSNIPILRLNSVTMEEYLTASSNQDPIKSSSIVDTSNISGSVQLVEEDSHYNSQSDDCDSGLVFTDIDDNELSSSDEGTINKKNGSFLINEKSEDDSKVNRRDSECSSDISSDGGVHGDDEFTGIINESTPNNKELHKDGMADRLIKQVELMFSDEHLEKDGFLLKHVRRRSDGFISLKLVAGLRKVKQICREFPVVLDTLRTSTKLEVNTEGTKIRRIQPLSNHLKSLPTPGGNKDSKGTSRQSIDASSQEVTIDRSHRRNSFNNHQNYQNQRRSSTRNNSIVSNSSGDGSRHGSFSRGSGNHHIEPLFRNMMVNGSNSCGHDDNHSLKSNGNQTVVRRRGGSLPVSVGITSSYAGSNQQYNYQGSSTSEKGPLFASKRNSIFLSPNSSNSPATETAFKGNPHTRPKSNSYCEGLGSISGNSNRRSSTGGMSLWLQQRRQESSRNQSEGSIIVSGVIRQPKGPDGTIGFSPASRQFLIPTI